MNTYLSYEVRMLIQFGRDVLSETEYRTAIRSTLRRYAWFLAKQRVRPWNRRDAKFYQYHRTEIQRMLAELRDDSQSERSLRRLRRWLRDVPAGDGPALGARAGGT
jgi:hypothetical protein